MRSDYRRVTLVAALLVLCFGMPAAIAFYVRDTSVFNPLRVGEKVPAFRVTSTDGRLFCLDSLNRKKILLAFFTASCGHCRQEIENLQALYDTYSGRLDFLGISLEGSQATKAMANEMKISFPIGIEDRGELSRSFKVTTVPAIFCIDTSGVLRFRYSGEHSLSIDRQIVEDLISFKQAY